jgi:hypothetical protein
MLAARARGLGTTWTTLHLLFEEEADQILSLPYAEVNQAGRIPVAYTRGTRFSPARRAEGENGGEHSGRYRDQGFSAWEVVQQR